ncbi:Ig-like domain-containing protein, partial [Candidatus Omnitrophota bacterium]
MKKPVLIILFAIIFILTVPCAWAGETCVFNVIVEIDATPPETKHDYDDSWRSADFTINLSASDTQSEVVDTYYKVDEGPQESVGVAGQPLVTIEGADNTLEYWSVDEYDNEELPHNMLSGIKLDKTPPSLSITNPEDEAVFTEAHIEIDGTVSDDCSDVEDIEIDVEGTFYTPTLESDGSFSLGGADLIGGPNNITALARDIAGNEGEYNITVFLGWVLHLDIPYYEIGDYYSGAASSQMILNYIRGGVADELTQEEIYNYGHPLNYYQNNSILEMDPRAMNYALGHFDPYDASDAYGYGDPYKGYNFSIAAFNDDQFTEYLRDIIHWMDFPVTIGYWWLGGDLVAWPNTPSAVPAYGSYEHWIVVNGAATDQDPMPAPVSNPGHTPDFTVYGVWLTDPSPSGIGQDLYVTPQSLQDTYLLPLVTSDHYNGKYLQVAEPPAEQSDAHVEMAEPKVNDQTLKAIEIANAITEDIPENLSVFEKNLMSAKRHIYDRALVVDLKEDTNLSSLAKEGSSLESVFTFDQESPIELDWEKIVDSSLLTDEGFKNAFNGSQARSFIKVRRTDKENNFYYIIPFDKYDKGEFLTYVAISINTEDGSFKEASWVKEPTRFIQIDREKAMALLCSEYPDLLNTELTAELIWEPGGYSLSPFYPYWRIAS